MEKQFQNKKKYISDEIISSAARSSPNKKCSSAVLRVTCQHGRLTSDMFFVNKLRYVGYFRDDNKVAALTFFLLLISGCIYSSESPRNSNAFGNIKGLYLAGE